VLEESYAVNCSRKSLRLPGNLERLVGEQSKERLSTGNDGVKCRIRLTWWAKYRSLGAMNNAWMPIGLRRERSAPAVPARSPLLPDRATKARLLRLRHLRCRHQIGYCLARTSHLQPSRRSPQHLALRARRYLRRNQARRRWPWQQSTIASYPFRASESRACWQCRPAG